MFWFLQEAIDLIHPTLTLWSVKATIFTMKSGDTFLLLINEMMFFLNWIFLIQIFSTKNEKIQPDVDQTEEKTTEKKRYHVYGVIRKKVASRVNKNFENLFCFGCFLFVAAQLLIPYNKVENKIIEWMLSVFWPLS